jgi:DNA-binding MarR family transcriptional regulator
VLYKDGYFTRENKDQALPRDVIEPTPQQQRAMEGIIDALREQDERVKDKLVDEEDDDDERDAELKHAIRNFYIALICQTVGSRPFQSAVLSFCAMLSQKKASARREANDGEQRKRCVWNEPGNFNSNLSALTWTAQLILFDFICFRKQDNKDEIPKLLDRICKKYFQQMAETPFSHILQWRLYLFAASRTNITKNQAHWSLNGQTIDYKGTKLHIEQVLQLVVSEFRQAHLLLYDKLLFAAKDITPIEA